MIHWLHQHLCRHQRYREVNPHTQQLELVCSRCLHRVPVAMTNVIVFPSAQALPANVLPMRKGGAK